MAWVEVEFADDDSKSMVNTDTINAMRNYEDELGRMRYNIYLNFGIYLTIKEESYNKIMDVIKKEVI